jgi:vancomycin aglycone glucosyltransferase
MRVAIATFGSRGDTQPFLALALELRRRGHRVGMWAYPDMADRARSLGVDYHTVGTGPIEERMREAAAQGARIRVMDLIRDMNDEQFAALDGAFDDADLVVAGGVNTAAFTCAEAAGVPYTYIATCPGLIPSDAPPYFLPPQGLPAWANRAIWSAYLASSRLTVGPVNERRLALGLPGVRDGFSSMLGGRPVLAADRALAPLPGALRVPVAQTAAMQLRGEATLPPELEAFIRAGEPPMFVGFGSATPREGARLAEMAIDAARAAGRRLLLSRGWAHLDAEPREDVFVVGDVSFDALFPRCAVVVHHGGAGTTATAARAGAPQVICPVQTDGYYWAESVARFGASPGPVPLKRLDTGHLAALVREAVGARVTERAGALRAATIDVDGAALTADELESRVE